MNITKFLLVSIFIVAVNGAAINSSLLSGRITLGEPVIDPKEAFFMASIRVSENPADPLSWLHICGGCLISLKHILSAAQCIMLLQGIFNPGLKNAAACIGNLKLSDPWRRYYIQDSQRHNGYNENNVFNTAVNDIGVILLEREVMVTDTVNKIDMFNFDVCMSSGMTFGWGSRQKSSLKNVFDENFSRNYLSQYLQKLVIATVRQGKDYGHLFRGLVNRNEANLVWGYGSNHMAHFSVGDAGNPFIVKERNIKYVAGIATYIPTEESCYPLFFVNVKYHKAWILQTMDHLSNLHNI